jgi:hypothetical protein
MRSKDSPSKVAKTNSVGIGESTEESNLIAREVGNLIVVRALLSVTKEHDTSDLVLHSRRKILDSSVIHGRALAVMGQYQSEFNDEGCRRLTSSLRKQ